MSTRPSIPSRLGVRSVPLALALAACATETAQGSLEPEPEPAAASAVAAAPEPAAASTSAEVAPAPAPEPEPIAAPNAAPATVKLAFHGRCSDIGVTTLADGSVVAYYDVSIKVFPWAEGWLHRMEPHGAVAESLLFPAPGILAEGGGFEVGKLFGSWSELRIVSLSHTREDTEGRLYRRVAGVWKQIETVGASTDIDDAWDGADGSILALADRGDYEASAPRLAVVLGKGKGPSLAKLERASKCGKGQFTVGDVTVRPDGTIVAVGGCPQSAWLGTWAPGDLEGAVARVKLSNPAFVDFELDDEGNGFIFGSGELARWKDGAATPIELPGRSKPDVVGARGGHAWYARGSSLSHWVDGQWQPIPTPEGRRIDWVAGLQFDTPWILFTNGTVAMRTTDGTWHDVALAPTPDVDAPPKAAGLYVTAPGDAWVEAKYTKYKKGSKTIGTRLRALYTTRDAPVAMRCGQESAAGPAPSDGDGETAAAEAG
jgi:hypothetical protein